MAEYAPPRADDALWRREHLPSAQSVLIELHRLVSIFFASRGFAESIAAPDGHGEELGDGLFLVRPAGRTHLRVEVPYTPGKGKC